MPANPTNPQSTPTTVTLATLDEFTRAYVGCALWSSTDTWSEIDADKDASDIAPETLARIADDCARFQAECIEEIAWDNRTRFPHRHTTHEYAGHDFWLTRNGHGAGFLDGDWLKPAEAKLAEASKRFGEFNLYVGDDGLIYGQ